MARCPEIFKGNRERGKYDRVAQILLTEFQAVSGNLRDHFSASGRREIALKGDRKITVPQMIFHLHSNAKAIQKVLLAIDKEDLHQDWKTTEAPSDKVVAYGQLLNAISDFKEQGLSAGDVFFDGIT
jgi:citrate lyase beta subunit